MANCKRREPFAHRRRQTERPRVVDAASNARRPWCGKHAENKRQVCHPSENRHPVAAGNRPCRIAGRQQHRSVSPHQCQNRTGLLPSAPGPPPAPLCRHTWSELVVFVQEQNRRLTLDDSDRLTTGESRTAALTDWRMAQITLRGIPVHTVGELPAVEPRPGFSPDRHRSRRVSIEQVVPAKPLLLNIFLLGGNTR